MDATAAFNSLFEDRYDEVYAFCARRVGLDDAADATSEVFATAWRRIHDIPEGADRAWLFGVARNTVLNRWRSRGRQARLLDRLSVTRAPDPIGPDAELERSEQQREVVHALRHLSRTDQELLIMSAWDELTAAEIAIILDISVSAVDQRVHRAKKRLAHELSESRATPASHSETSTGNGWRR